MSQAVAKKKDIGLQVASIHTELTAFLDSGTSCCQLHKRSIVANSLLEDALPTT